MTHKPPMAPAAHYGFRVLKDTDLTGAGLPIAAAILVLITLFWWGRLFYLGTYTAPEELALPLALAFMSGVLCTIASVFGGRG